MFINKAYSRSLLDYKLINSRVKSYTYKQACEELINTKGSYLPIIEKENSKNLDCMGHKLNVSTFCKDKQIKSDTLRDFARVIINDKDNKIYCQRAEIVIVKYKCSKNNLNAICDNTLYGCKKIGKVLANKLEVVHHSSTSKETFDFGKNKPKVLNCYYQNKKRNLNSIL
jgi:hypothetical protein